MLEALMRLMVMMMRLNMKILLLLLTWKGVLQAVGRVVEAGGGGGAQEVLHLLQRAVGPVEAPGGSPQVAHHVSILPWAGLGPWGAPKVGGSSITIMDSS